MPSTSYVNVIFFPSADAEESSLPFSHVNFHAVPLLYANGLPAPS